MTRIDLDIPETLKAFVDEQVAARGLGSANDYLRELLDRERLRALILEGANSPVGPVADDAYFEGLKRLARGQEAD